MTNSGDSKASQPAVKRPKSADPNWQKKAQVAREAREMGKQMRAGKPTSFRAAVGRHA